MCSYCGLSTQFLLVLSSTVCLASKRKKKQEERAKHASLSTAQFFESLLLQLIRVQMTVLPKARTNLYFGPDLFFPSDQLLRMKAKIKRTNESSVPPSQLPI